jgi:hypothetical protein
MAASAAGAVSPQVAVKSALPTPVDQPAPAAPAGPSAEAVASEVAEKIAREVAEKVAARIAEEVAKKVAEAAAGKTARDVATKTATDVATATAKRVVIEELAKNKGPGPQPPTPPKPGPGIEPGPGDFDQQGPTAKDAPKPAEATKSVEATPDTFSPASEKPAAKEVPQPPGSAPGAAPGPEEASAIETPAGSTFGEMRTWKDDTGRFETRARLVRILDGEVGLVRESGASLVVPMHRLSPADRQYVAQSAYGPMRTWKDDTGRYESRAWLAVILDDNVRLLNENGNYMLVPRHRLSLADQQYVAQCQRLAQSNLLNTAAR